MAREGKLQARIKKRLKIDFGGKWYVIAGGPFQETGIHDIIGCLEGRFVGFEVKRSKYKEKWDPIQKYQHHTILSNGGISGRVTSYSEAKTILLAHGFELKPSGKGTKFTQTFQA